MPANQTDIEGGQADTQAQLDLRAPEPLTLLDELEAIDKALLDGEATEDQERRGQEIVTLANAIPRIQQEIEHLRKELEEERIRRKRYEREAQRSHRELCDYKRLNSIYSSIRQTAEFDAQLPFDDQYRECLWGLQAIAADPEACNCKARGWLGEGHDFQCPVRIATEAPERAKAAAEEARKVREPLFVRAKGGAA